MAAARLVCAAWNWNLTINRRTRRERWARLNPISDGKVRRSNAMSLVQEAHDGKGSVAKPRRMELGFKLLLVCRTVRKTCEKPVRKYGGIAPTTGDVLLCVLWYCRNWKCSLQPAKIVENTSKCKDVNRDKFLIPRPRTRTYALKDFYRLSASSFIRLINVKYTSCRAMLHNSNREKWVGNLSRKITRESRVRDHKSYNAKN